MASTNPFDEPNSAESTQTTPCLTRQREDEKTSPDKHTKRPLEEFADLLLEEKLILTALELNTELLESGREVPKLSDYFSNPGNFEQVMPQPVAYLKSEIVRTPSMSTFDSLELGGYSDDGKDTDERVAVLEFELRKANDTIKSLRGSLTKASDIRSKGDEIRQNQTNKNEPIKPHEKRALNYLVHEYLNDSDSKLTAISLSEENGDQNLEDWDDVGLNIPKPPALIQQFRHYDSLSLGGHEQLNRISHMEKEMSSLNSQILALKRENESLQLKIRKQSLASIEVNEGGYLLRQNVADPSRKAFTPDFTRARDSRGFTPKVLFAENNSKSTTEVSSPTLSKDKTLSPSSFQEEGEESPRDVSSLTGSESQSMTVVVETASPESIKEDMTDDIGNKKTGEEKEGGDKKWEVPKAMEKDVSTLKSTERPWGAMAEEGEKKRQGGAGTDDVHRSMSVAFRQELLSILQIKTDSKVGLEVSRLSDPELDVIELFGRCLPDIVPNVLLAKREELIPVLLCVISRHSNHKERDKLLQILFNLIKRPNNVQRQMIMSGCVAFVKLNEQAEMELFNQIWEQIDHKYYERRLLVAESCGVLVPHVQPALRGSLVLSVLQQMLLSDKAESVRQAVVKSLGVLVAFVDDLDKFKQCWELLLSSLNDTSQLVSSTAHTVLLPAMAAWAHELDRLESDLILYFLEQLHTCVKQVSQSEGESGATERCQQHIITLTYLVPWHFTSVLLSGPLDSSSDSDPTEEVSFPHPFSRLLNVHVIVGDDSKLYRLVAGLEAEIKRPEEERRRGGGSWKKLTWLIDECLRRLLKSIEVLGFIQSEILHSLVTLVSAYCTYFGQSFTDRIIKPLFQSHLKVSKDSKNPFGTSENSPLISTILPVYVCGVLTSFKDDEPHLAQYVQDTIVELSLSYAPLDSLKATILEMKRERRNHPQLVKILNGLSSHSAVQVRRNVTTLLGLMVGGVDERIISNDVIRTLLRLASDSEMQVKIQSVESLGVIMETVSNREVLNGVHRQFEVFSGQIREDFLFYETILRTLSKIVPNADPVFRDEFIIPFLTEVAAQNNEAPNLTQRRDVARVLLEAYRGLSGCFVSVELLSSYIIPGLKALVQDFEIVDQSNVSSIKQLVHDNEEKLAIYPRHSGSEGSKDVSGNLLSKFTPPRMSFSFKKKS